MFAILIAMMACGVTRMGSVAALLVAPVITALSVGLWLAALSALYRDFRYDGLPGADLALRRRGASQQHRPAAVAGAVCLNPMVGIVDGFRWRCLEWRQRRRWSPFRDGGRPLFALRMIYFRRMERTMAD